jgi:hypothetical protein
MRDEGIPRGVACSRVRVMHSGPGLIRSVYASQNFSRQCQSRRAGGSAEPLMTRSHSFFPTAPNRHLRGNVDKDRLAPKKPLRCGVRWLAAVIRSAMVPRRRIVVDTKGGRQLPAPVGDSRSVVLRKRRPKGVLYRRQPHSMPIEPQRQRSAV